MAYRRSALPPGRQRDLARAFIGSISSGDLVEIDAPFGDLLSNGFGAVAVARLREPAGDIERPDYIVWTGEEASEPMPGYPVGWSPEGDMIAVLHPITPTRGISGWLEIVSWPGLQPIFEDESRTVISEVWFDPGGKHVAYASVAGDGRDAPLEYFIRAIDVASREVAGIPIDDHTDFRWNAASEIVALSGHNSIDTYTPTGEPIASDQVDRYWIIKASADGSTLVFYEGEEDVSVAVGRPGAIAEIALPDGELGNVTLSPDGDHLAIVVALPAPTGSSREQLYVLDV
jgi:hypothetical protein